MASVKWTWDRTRYNPKIVIHMSAGSSAPLMRVNDTEVTLHQTTDPYSASDYHVVDIAGDGSQWFITGPADSSVSTADTWEIADSFDVGSVTLIISDIVQLNNINTVDLAQRNTINIQDIVQTMPLSTIIVTQKHILNTINLFHAMEIEIPTLSVAVSLIVQELIQNNTLTSLELTQHSNLITSELRQGHKLFGGVDLSQINNLFIDDIVQNQNIEEVTLVIAGLLQVANLLNKQDTGIPGVIQSHGIVVNNINQSQLIESVELILDLLLEVTGLSQDHSVNSLNITTVNVLIVNNLGQTQTLEEMSVVQAYRLLTDNLQNNQDISSISFATAKGKVTVAILMAVPKSDVSITIPTVNFSIE